MAKVSNLAVDALAKETKYEKLAEAEELDREVMMELDNRKKLEQVKAANECEDRNERRAAALAQEALLVEEEQNQVD